MFGTLLAEVAKKLRGRQFQIQAKLAKNLPKKSEGGLIMSSGDKGWVCKGWVCKLSFWAPKSLFLLFFWYAFSKKRGNAARTRFSNALPSNRSKVSATMAQIELFYVNLLRSRFLYISNIMKVARCRDRPFRKDLGVLTRNSDVLAGRISKTYEMLSEIDPYGSIWAHIKTGKSDVAQDRFQTPPDSNKGNKKSEMIKNHSKILCVYARACNWTADSLQMCCPRPAMFLHGAFAE